MPRFLRLALIAATATTSLTAPVLAQSGADDQRFQAAQQRFDSEYQRFRQEVDRYQAARGRGYRAPQGYDQGYAPPPPPQGGGYYSDDRDENGYDAARYYRPGNYQERVVSADERVYAGNDGRYYCKRSDGTTGLIVGGLGGGVLGNVIAPGGSKTLGTILGGGLGAVLGNAIGNDNNRTRVQCR